MSRNGPTSDQPSSHAPASSGGEAARAKAFADTLYAELGGEPGSSDRLLPYGDRSKASSTKGFPRSQLDFPEWLKEQLVKAHVGAMTQLYDAGHGGLEARAHAHAVGHAEQHAEAQTALRKQKRQEAKARGNAVEAGGSSTSSHGDSGGLDSRLDAGEAHSEAASAHAVGHRALSKIITLFCVSCVTFHAHNSMQQDHTEAYAIIQKKETKLLTFLNDPANREVAKHLLSDPRFKGVFKINPGNNKVELTRSGGRMIYSNPDNLWLLCSGCNGGKSDTPLRDWFGTHPLFGPDFIAFVESEGKKIQSGILVDRAYAAPADAPSENIDGRVVPMNAGRVESIANLAMDWFCKHYGKSYSVMNALETELVQKVEGAVKAALPRDGAVREEQLDSILASVDAAVREYDIHRQASGGRVQVRDPIADRARELYHEVATTNRVQLGERIVEASGLIAGRFGGATRDALLQPIAGGAPYLTGEDGRRFLVGVQRAFEKYSPRSAENDAKAIRAVRIRVKILMAVIKKKREAQYESPDNSSDSDHMPAVTREDASHMADAARAVKRSNKELTTGEGGRASPNDGSLEEAAAASGNSRQESGVGSSNPEPEQPKAKRANRKDSRERGGRAIPGELKDGVEDAVENAANSVGGNSSTTRREDPDHRAGGFTFE